MAGTERHTDAALSRLEALRANPHKFHIFFALRVIEAAYKDSPRLGRSRRPAQDPLRIEQVPELAFPPATISEFEPRSGTRPGRLANRFFGLFGPHGPLPLHLTEYARDRLRNWRDPTLIAFANMFHHRMTSLLYRAWAASEPAACFDRPDDDPFSDKVAALAGLKGAAFVDRDAMPDMAKRNFAGRLAHGPRNEDGLLALVSHFFRAPVRIDSFVGSWLILDARERFRFGMRAPLGKLGQSVSVGERVWSRQAKFRIHIGPIDIAAYRRLLPGGDSLLRLRALVRNYLGDTLDWDVNLILKAAEVPQTRLGVQGALGWTCWIGQRKPDQDADDLYLTPPEAPHRDSAPSPAA